MKSYLGLQQLIRQEQAAFVLENMAGKARREILGRGTAVTSDPDKNF